MLVYVRFYYNKECHLLDFSTFFPLGMDEVAPTPSEKEDLCIPRLFLPSRSLCDFPYPSIFHDPLDTANAKNVATNIIPENVTKIFTFNLLILK